MFCDKLNVQMAGEKGRRIWVKLGERGTMQEKIKNNKSSLRLETVRKRICFGVFVRMRGCIRGSESPHTYTHVVRAGAWVFVCSVCVPSTSKRLMLIVSLLLSQLSCTVNKSVLIGSASPRPRYQNLIKSLFRACV